MTDYERRYQELMERYREETIGLRRALHQRAETAGKEVRTTAFIRDKLKEWGVEIVDQPFRTGLLARVDGGGPGRTVCLRADIDALPCTEASGLPFASEMKGVCHCCGHDLHTAALLNCARILQETRELWNGSVCMIFQPAEETGEGAKYMVGQGALERLKPDLMLGFHCWPELPAGTIGVRRGPMMAASDSLRIEIAGRGGHGAHPHKCVDPIMIASYVLQQMQNIVSREISPVDSAVITVGKIRGGEADNSIPASVRLEGTVRSLTGETRERLQKAIFRVVTCTAEAMGGSGSVQFVEDGEPLICDEKTVDAVVRAAERSGLPVTRLAQPSMGMEDFAYYLRDIPGAYFRVGTADERPESRCPLHSPEIVFSEEALQSICAVVLQFVGDGGL